MNLSHQYTQALKTLFLLLPFFLSLTIRAQQAFSIDEAIQYTAENNVNAKKAKIDREIASQKVKETIGIGLPQLNGKADYNHFLNAPISPIPAQFFDPNAPAGSFIGVQFSPKQSMDAGITLTQLLFNGSYLVGLQSSKAYKETMALAEEKTAITLRQGVLMSYAAVLVTDENLKTLEENRKVVEKILHDTQVTYKTGLAEFQNVEQAEFSYKNLVSNIENLQRNRKKALKALKYLMGYPLDQEITLSTNMDELIQKNDALVSIDKDQDVHQHIDFRMVENMVKINQLKLKLQKSTALPSLGAALSSSYNAFDQKFNFFNPSKKWYNTTVLAIQLNVPIFSGLQRHWQTEQAKLDLKKSEMDREDTERKLKNNIYAASIDFENSQNSLKTARELVELSSSIYKKQHIKFTEGLGNSLELQQSETQLYDSQAKYYQAALGLIQSKVQLDQALGK